ncbi:MAG: tetratricopeptide repeat protein [Nitrospinales bacterium]
MNKSSFLTFSICLLLAAATFAVFGQTLENDFVHYDDDDYIIYNERIKEGFTRESVLWALTTQRPYWHPVTWLSHILDYRLFGLKPGGHHFTSVLLHALTTVLLFLLLRRMTGAVWRSALAAALFGIHPLHVESVAWVAERKDVLSALFWVLTTWAYVRHVERPAARRYLWLVLCFALGLMAKPMLVTLPFTLLLLDYWPLNRWRVFAERGAVASMKASGFLPLVWEKIPLFLLAALASIVTYVTDKRLGTIIPLEELSLASRVANALAAYVAYVGKTVWPAHLSVFYPHPFQDFPVARVWVLGIALAAVSAAVIWRLRRRPYLGVGWLWYLGTLVPVIGLVQAGVFSMADRYMYIPSIGLFVMAVWGGADLAARWRIPGAGSALCAGAVILALMTTAWFQVKHWRNTMTLFDHARRVVDDNYFAHYQLGLVLEKEGQTKKALEHFAAAVRIRPNFAEARNGLGLSLLRLGRYEEARSHLAVAIKIKPVFPEAYVNMGVALGEQDRWRQAIPWFFKALELRPRLESAHEYLGRAFVNQGNLETAAKHFSEAIAIEPDSAEAHNNLGFVLARLGQPDKAAGQLREAIRLRPSLAEAHFNLANILAARGSLEEAAGHYARAVEADADLLEARHNLGIALVKLGRLKEAEEAFDAVLKRRPDFELSRRAAQDLRGRLTQTGRRQQ